MTKHRLSKLFTVCLFALFASVGWAQNTIKGNVEDADTGSPVEFASILLKGTTTGTTTNGEGAFSINVTNLPATLVISFVGYNAQEVIVEKNAPLKIKLEKSSAALDEIVVVGYGSVRKKDLTGSVASISSKDFNPGAITNPLQQLAGKAAGVNITQVSGEPGKGPSIRIRGITSLSGGSDPLYVVDGVQGDGSLLNQVPPNEIESIDVLKDASATAIYGSRGAPGVVIITTKKGKSGQNRIDYTGFTSVNMFTKKLKTLSASEWRQQAKTWGVGPEADHGADTDWWKLLTRVGSTNNHTLSMSGGGNTFNYRASVNAILQKGTVINSDYNTYNARLQLNQKALDNRLDLTYNVNASFSNGTESPDNVGKAYFSSGLINNSYIQRPTDPVYNPDGSYFIDNNVFSYLNPLAFGKEVKRDRVENSFFGSMRAEYEIIDGLKPFVFGSWRKVTNNFGYFLPARSTDITAIAQKGLAGRNSDNKDEKLMDLGVNYNKSWGPHKLMFTGVYEWQRMDYQGFGASARGFVNDITTYNALQLGSLSAAQSGDVNSYRNDKTLISFLARANYSLYDKYLLTVSMRRDGSSLLGTNSQWGNFPSMALAWNLGDEEFMKGLSGISNLKLKGGFGITGNVQAISPQQTLALVGGAGTTFFGGTQISSFAIYQNANKDLRWETKKMYNTGLSFDLLKEKLSVNLEAYTSTTSNLLFNYTVPQPPFPSGSMIANIGSLQNKGIDLTLNYTVIDKKDLTLSIFGTISLMKNKVLELSGNLDGVPLITDYVSWGPDSYLIKGQPIGTWKPLKHLGKDESNAETVVDVDGDGKIDQGSLSNDRVFAGQALPKYIASLSPRIGYKNWSFSMLWRASGGNKINNTIRKTLSYYENIGKQNMLSSASELGIFTSKYGSDLFLENGAFVRFDNFNIGYTFNTRKLKSISALSLTFTGNNLFVITKYKGYDPEVKLTGENGTGQDNGYYPQRRSYGLGLNISLK